MGAVVETGSDEYAPNGFSKTLTEERYSDAFPLMYAIQFTKNLKKTRTLPLTLILISQDIPLHPGNHCPPSLF
jgi:hypothetical protein